MTRILVVDDHEIVRRGLRDLLTNELAPVTIVEAATSSDAVSRLTTESWDLVLLDINLPGRDGFDVLDESKRLQPSTPVIMLTSYPEEQFAVRAFRHGASAYVAKHEAAELLIAAVRRVLAGGRFVTPSLAERLAASLVTTDLPPHELLSSRELQVLRLVAQGRTQREVAAALQLSEKTIATYRARIADKTGLTTGVEITRYAMQHHLAD